jgi:hypothetical protein
MERLTVPVDATGFENSAVGLVAQLERRPGIAHVDLDADMHTVAVEFDQSRITASDVSRLIAECGYHGYLANSAPVTVQRPQPTANRPEGRPAAHARA